MSKAQKLCVQKWSYEYRDVASLCTRKLLIKNSQNCVHRCNISVHVKKKSYRDACVSLYDFQNRTEMQKVYKGCTTVQLHSVILRYTTVALC